MKHYRRGSIIPHAYDRWEYTLNRDGSICLHAYHGNTDVLYIPEMLMHRPVTSLARMFFGPYHAQLIVIPPTVKSIGAYAMSHDEDLRGVVIPPETTCIHETAFEDQMENEDFCLYVTEGSCGHAFAEQHGIRYELDAFPTLEDDAAPCLWGDWSYAVIDEGQCVIREYNGTDPVVEVPAEIDGYAVIGLNTSSFFGNMFMEELIVPEGVEYLGHFAAQKCPALRRVYLPDSMKMVGGSCFAFCRSLEEIRLPAGLEMIMLMTFVGCTALRSITLPQTVHTIMPMAFNGCTALEEIHTSPVLRYVSGSAVEKCPKLRRPSLPDTLEDESRAVLSKLPA